MKSRVDELHYNYCAPKPWRHFKLWDTDTTAFPDNETEEAKAEINSIDIYVHLIT